MLFKLPDKKTLYTALLERDPTYEGFVYVGVKTTGVFCRLTCPARNPKPENIEFYETVAECLESGFRPCKRCKPLEQVGQPEPLIQILTNALEEEPEKRWKEADIKAMGFDPSTVRRLFKRRFGITFLDMARLRRVGNAVNQLSSGSSVIEAQLDAGYESGSGFRAAITRLIGKAPANIRNSGMLKAEWIETPIGTMLAVADEHVLHLLEYVDRKALPGELKKLQEKTQCSISMGKAKPLEQIANELSAYFAGDLMTFQTPLANHGSEFYRSVWQALIDVPFGETHSYSELAQAIDKPTATRAVARANGANQIAIVIPCHRIIGADGSLTGYGGGLWRKSWLIRHEQQTIIKGGTDGLD